MSHAHCPEPPPPPETSERLRLQQLTEAMLQQRWHKCGTTEAGRNLTSCRPPSSRLVQELLELIRSSESCTVGELKPMIRRLMIDRDYLAADTTSHAHNAAEELFERNLNITIEVLTQVQQLACQRGEWTTQGQAADVPMVG